MRHLRLSAVIVVIFTFLFLVFGATKAQAYIDPGTGSYILQVTIGLLLGASLTIKIFWGKIKTFLASYFSKEKKDD